MHRNRNTRSASRPLVLAHLWLAGLLLAVPRHAAADGAALHAVADGHLYHVASDTGTTTLAARLDVDIESMTTLDGLLFGASSGTLPALYQVATDGMTDLRGPFDQSSLRSIARFRGMERFGDDILALDSPGNTLYRIDIGTGLVVRQGVLQALRSPWGILTHAGVTYISDWVDDDLHILHDDFTTTTRLGESGVRDIAGLEVHNSRSTSAGLIYRTVGA